MDKSPRLAAILPLKITVGNDSRAQFAHTLDISSSGLRVILPLAPDPGCNILLEHKKKRARAVVVWSRQIKNSRTDYEVGMRLLDDGQRFWLVDFAPNAHVLEFTGQSDERLGHRNKDS